MKNKLLMLLILLFPFMVQAIEPDTLNIEEILITAKKVKNGVETPVYGETIHLLNPHDGGEIFKFTPGFSVVKKGNYAMEPVLRGYKFEQLNIQFDGGVHSTNACPNRMDPAISQISVEEIEKIEVIKGPYSVRFGPVFGGVVNVISKRPVKKNNRMVSGYAEGGYQSNGSNYYANVYAQIVNKKWDFALNAGYKDYGNYKSGNGDTIASSFRRFGYTAKLGYNINKNQRVQLNVRQSFAKDVLYPGLPMDAIKDNSTIASADYAASNLSEQFLSLKIKAYTSYIDHLMSNELRPSYGATHALTPVEARNFGGRVEAGIKTGMNSILYTGVDYQYIWKNGVRNRDVYKNICVNPPVVFDPPKSFVDKVWQNSNKRDLGLFAENKWQISESFTWQLGLRVDFVSYNIKDPEQDFSELYGGDIKPDNKLSPAINSILTKDLGNGLRFQWAIAMAQRTPDLSELFINHLSVGMDAYEYVGNPNLKPESNYQTDLKVEKSGETVNFYVDLFYSRLKNYISAVVDTTIPRKFMPCANPKFTKKFTNIDDAYMTGFEAGFGVMFLKHFNYKLGVAYTYGQNLSVDEPLPEIPPFTINTALSYSVEHFEAVLNAQIAAGQNRVSTSYNESTTPGYNVFNLYLSYSPWEFLDITGAITNMFNVNYVEHLSRPYKNMDYSSLYYEPGRSFNLGIRFKF